jgi:hypothetical protein
MIYIFITSIPSACSKEKMRVQSLFYINSTEGTVHLFISMERSPDKNAFVTLTYTHNPNTKH